MAEIDNPGTAAIAVTGPASVLDLSVSGQVNLIDGFTVGALTLGIPPGTLGGSYAGLSISIIGLDGNIAARSLTVGGVQLVAGSSAVQAIDYAVVDVAQGVILSAGSVELESGALQVDGGTLNIDAGLTLGVNLAAGPDTPPIPLTGGGLDISDRASVHLGSLVIANGNVSVDATSTLEIGDAGTAAAGTITIDQGAVLDASNDQPAGAADAIFAPILNNGTIYADFDLSDTVNNGTIFATDATLSRISGNGQLDIGNASTIGPDVSGTLDLRFSTSIDFALGDGVTIGVSDTPRIINFAVGNTIVLQGITADTAIYTADPGAENSGADDPGADPTIGTLTLENGTIQVASLTILGSYGRDAFAVTSEPGDSVLTLTCFAAGTRIATPTGQVAVDALRAGDEVSLASGGSAPIVWIGRRSVDCRSHPKPQQILPVRVRRGAFAPGIPVRDLFLSPDHAVFAEGVLIPVKHLINGDTIQQVARKTVQYFHIELPAHDVVLAEGLAVESYLDTGDRANFDNAGRVVALFPVFASLAWEAYGYAPLVVTGPPVEAARLRIASQAGKRHAAPGRQSNRKTA